ncbi:hypothetical protein ID866_1871 [Astraeus odoratus]|nr:hypothetical protein ID866_1871 [Astraeus odoratus]
MKERLSQAYQYASVILTRLTANSIHSQFTLAMQSGAFIQLIVLLSAISSRMSVLLSELAQVLPLITTICDRLLALHNPEHRFRRKSSLSLDVNPDSLSNNADQAQLHFGDGNCSNSNINAAYDALPMLDIRPANALTNGIEDVERIIIPPPEKVKTGPTYGKEERHKSKKVKKEEPDEIDAIFGF